MDKLVWDNQIGKLGDRTESNLYNPSQKLPIFEMRDISGVTMPRIAEKLKTVEEKVKKYHQDAPKSIKRRQTTGKTCKRPASEEKERGKCPEGQILDPAQGGQDKNTEKPVCIADDDKKCPPGQVAETRRKNSKVDNEADYEPNCAASDPADDNFKCDDPNTYHHKQIPFDSDKMKHSCRATRKVEDDKKNKYQEKAKEAKEGKDKTDKERKEKQEKEEKKNGKRRARMGSCWIALAEVTAWTVEEMEALTQDEVDGMMDLWPENTIEPVTEDGSIPDYVIKIQAQRSLFVGGIGMETAGIPNIFGIIKSAIQGAAGSSKAAAKAVRNYKSGGKSAASAKAVDAAKNSGTISKIIKDKRFLDCLATTAAVTGMEGVEDREQTAPLTLTGELSNSNPMRSKRQMIKPYIEIDWSRKDDLKKQPEDRDGDVMVMRVGSDEDFNENGYGFHEQMSLQTWPDSYVRDGRLLYETCSETWGDWTDNIEAAEVRGGCCAFYDGTKCEADGFLFAMENREHGDLQGAHRNTIASWWCTFNAGCAGAPGV